MVVTGDLTDSTNGNFLGIPNGPYQAEWDAYKSILDGNGADPRFFYDLPGNHDAYSDTNFAYYLANSVQGRDQHATQISWTKTFSFGTYHFLGVNSRDNTGAVVQPRLALRRLRRARPDRARRSSAQELADNAAADLTFVFGHHPVTDTGASDDTWLFYGHQAVHRRPRRLQGLPLRLRPHPRPKRRPVRRQLATPGRWSTAASATRTSLRSASPPPTTTTSSRSTATVSRPCRPPSAPGRSCSSRRRAAARHNGQSLRL